MATGIFSRSAALAALTIGLAACGSSTGGSTTGGGASATGPASVTVTTGTASLGTSTSGTTFAWLHAQAAPSGWHAVTISSGASMAYPPGWRLSKGDPGTATAALRNADGDFLGYLNLTPRQGHETLANWRTFRPHHDADEGDRHVKLLSAAMGLRFLNGRGSCVKVAYTTSSGVRYVEIACLVAGPRHQSVIVAAAPPQAWSRTAPALERALEGVRT